MQSHQQTKRRKKRVLQVQITKTVTVVRGKFGYGFTISGQNPCMLSCIVPGSPAQIAGLKAGDLLYFVNGQNVSRACHDDVVRMVGLSTESLEIQVAENYNSSDSSDDDYLPRTKSRYPNRVRTRHSLEEKGFKHERISSSCLAVKQNYGQNLEQFHPCEEESDLSSSLTSQDDQAWLNPTDVAWHGHCQARPEKSQYLIEGTGKYKNEQIRSKVYSQKVMSTAKKISSAAAVVKRVRTVTDSLRPVQQGGSEEQMCEDSQSCMLPLSEISHVLTKGDNKRYTKQFKQTENVKAIVGYIGSIETPSSHTYPHQRLQALRHAVRRLRLMKKVHDLVLMEVKPSGIFLTNTMGKQVALYPSDRIVFTGICPDDERFFGLVTSSVPDEDCSSYVGGGECLRKPNSTCHIFVIESDVNPHSAHFQQTQSFQIACMTNPQTGQCDQCPVSASSLILCIANLYRDKPSRKFDSDIVQSQAFADPAKQSEHYSNYKDSDQELGKDEVSLEQNEQVCVVDMSSGREQLDTSSMSVASLMSLRHHLSPEMDAGGTLSPCLISSSSNEQCCKPVSQLANKLTPQAMPDQLVNKLTPQAMPDPACLTTSKPSGSSELSSTVRNAESLKQSMQRYLQARHQQLEQQNYMIDQHVLSLSVSEDGHTVLEAGNVGHRRPPETTFAEPTKPPPTSIHHKAGRSAFHLLRSTSAPIVKHCKAETVDLDIRDKLSPRAFPHNSPSSVFFRSPSAPPGPFFPHRDSDDEKDEVDESEDDPYIRQILEQFSKDNNTDIDTGIPRISQGFHTSQQCEKETIGLTGVQKWTKMGSLRRMDGALLKQSFSQSLESLAVGEDAAHRLVTSCSVHNVASHTPDHDFVSKAGRVAIWAVHFDKLLKDPLGIDVFTEFLEKEFSDENIRFWKVCEQFHDLTSGFQLKIHAKDIYMQYLSVTASDPVNVDNTAKLYTEQFLDDPKPFMFDVAQHQILQLMRLDSYPRFLKSDLYKSMLLEELGGKRENGQHQLEKVLENKCVKKQSAGKENGGKRRRSILPWKLNIKSGKVTSDCQLTKKGKAGTSSFYSSDNQLNVSTSCHSTTTTTATITISSNNSSSIKTTGLGIDLSTMRKEIFHPNEIHGCSEPLVKFCRIIMPDGSTTVVCAKPGQTSLSVLSKLCEKRSISISSVDVFLLGSDKLVDLNEDISTLGSKEIVLEKRVVFLLDLPDGKSVGAKAKPNRSIKNVLKPILNNYGYSMDSISVHLTSSDDMIDLEMPVSRLDNQRVVVMSDTAAGSQKRRATLFGLFRNSEKRLIMNRKQQPEHSDLGCSKES